MKGTVKVPLTCGNVGTKRTATSAELLQAMSFITFYDVLKALAVQRASDARLARLPYRR